MYVIDAYIATYASKNIATVHTYHNNITKFLKYKVRKQIAVSISLVAIYVVKRQNIKHYVFLNN